MFNEIEKEMCRTKSYKLHNYHHAPININDVLNVENVKVMKSHLKMTV